MKALQSRNKMSHTYDSEVFEKTVAQVADSYYPAFERMRKVMEKFVVESPEHHTNGLTDQQLAVLRSVLARYAERISLVGLFGSRATGRWRPASDVDLVLYGDVDEDLVWSVYTDLQESYLSISADVKGYDLVSFAPLREHIDHVMQPLFTHDELVAAGEASKIAT